MSDLLSKLSTYNIFNYLLPGSIFVFLCRARGIFRFGIESIIVEFFLYYFAGMTISRIGSIIVEPTCLKLGIVKYAPYRDYLRAAKADPQIEVLLEANNTYRTIVAMFVCVLIAAGVVAAAAWLRLSDAVVGLVVAVLMTILYVMAYRKQTAYIRKRVERQMEE